MTIKFTEPQAEVLIALRAELAAARHGTKGAITKAYAQQLGVAVQTLHRWLAAHPGSGSGRAKRADAGTTEASYEELKAIGAALYESIRQNGRRVMTIENSIEMLTANGVITTGLSAGRISTLLYQNGLHPTQLNRPTPAVEQRSLHPNWVWQVDASVCVAYYLSNATGLQVMDEKQFYKNKPGNLTRIQQERLIRYAMADHYSHTLLTRYYLGSESADNLTEFLIWCFACKLDGAAPAHAMHGVPFLLQMDQGSANMSKQARNLLARLDVKVQPHERHNSRANGAVEKAHHIIETHFESGLRFRHVDDLDDLNAKALAWAHDYCATRVHTRFAKPRYDLWMRITEEQLRVAPPVSTMRDLVNTYPTERRVSNNLTVDFVPVRGEGSRDYDLRYLPGVMAGNKVKIVVNAYRRPAIDVAYWDAETRAERWMTVEPNERTDAGHLITAPIIGQELRQGHRGLIDKAREQALLAAYGDEIPDEATTHTDRVAAAEKAKEAGALVFGGAVDPFKRVAQAKLPTMLPKRGTPLDVSHLPTIDPPIRYEPIASPAPATREVPVHRVTAFQACRLILAALERLGAVHAYDVDRVYPWIEAKYAAEGGMPEEHIEAVARQLMANQTLQVPTPPTDGQPQLRAVQGSDA